MNTWLSLSERPPPPPRADGRALPCWFLLDDDRKILGRYHGKGRCQLITDRNAAQQILPLTNIVGWQPFDVDQLEEWEGA